MIFYIGKNKNKEVVSTYRVHKNYDMVTFKDKNYIDDVNNYIKEYMRIIVESNVKYMSDLVK